MNYLGHLILSGNNSEITFGNFIADALKGTDFSRSHLDCPQTPEELIEDKHFKNFSVSNKYSTGGTPHEYT